MTPNMAYNILISKYPDLYVRTCHEYDSAFVFNAIPSFIPDKKKEIFDSLYGIDKKTRNIFTFQPFSISQDEYDRGVEVKSFK